MYIKTEQLSRFPFPKLENDFFSNSSEYWHLFQITFCPVGWQMTCHNSGKCSVLAADEK